jgi:predicted O-methyltransferase YrrM
MKNGLQFSGKLLLLVTLLLSCSRDQAYTQVSDLDKRVNDFLNGHISDWHDMNVPASDGKLLYDLIIKNKYKNALEIGTSTGHSSIWMAWALSKTGGKLTTIEINERRYNEAMENFKKAGLTEFIDAKLGDAHEMVKTLPGPFDFVFSDADKDWYINYFRDIDPKLSVGGCFTSHNIGMYGARDFYDYIRSLPNYETTADNHGAGMSVSYKKSR